MFLHCLMCMSVWCVTIHEMPAINGITAKIDRVLFMCNCFLGLRKRTQRTCSCRKSVSKISANFSNCDGVYYQKRIISTTGECALKKSSATLVFLYCDINQFNQSMEISFFSTCVFFDNHSRIKGLQGKGEGISLTPQYHFHPLHRHLDISRAITA